MKNYLMKSCQMKSYLGLVPVSARVHRRQSRMTRICIVLAVFLVTSIFSMADMWLRAAKTEMINKHGNYHVILQNVSGGTAVQIRRRTDIACSSAYKELNQDTDKCYYVNGKNTVLYGIEETYPTGIMNYPARGSFPQNDGEIALSADAEALFGIDTGDMVVLSTPAGELDFTVTAFYEDDSEWNEIIDGCCAYMTLSAFQTICDLNGETVSSAYYIRFAGEENLGKRIADIKEEYGLADQNIDENTAVLGLLGASGNAYMKNIYVFAAACFLLILIAGILMISSCMNSTVAQRTSFFGMMRCIGASRQQIVRFVRLEALNWCKVAIPAGCLLGMAVCWAACAVLRLFVKGEFADMPLFGVSVSGIICGIAVGVITVFIAAQSPARQAAKVSPIAAVSGSAQTSGTIRHAANTRFFKVETSLGIHHATAAKRNLFLMTGSFALTIILFLAFSACLDIVRRLLPSESNFSPDVAIASPTDSNTIDRNLAAQLSEIPGVKEAFGTMYVISLPVQVNGDETVIDLISYDAFMLENTKKSVASGDLSKVYGDSGFVFTIFSEDSRFDVGDQIKIGDDEMEIACVASEGIGSVSGSAVVVCSEETFVRLVKEQPVGEQSMEEQLIGEQSVEEQSMEEQSMGEPFIKEQLIEEPGYMMINIILEKGAPEEVVNQIRSLAGDNLFVDRRAEEYEQHSSYWVFRIAAYSFLAIISFITVLNIMNSVSMGVSARMKQYGAMRAVGMEGRQVTKMILGEAATYTFCGMAVGLILGLSLHYFIYVKMVVTHFGGSWQVPVATIALIFLLVSVSCIVAVWTPAKRIRNMAITAAINEL